MVSSIICDCWLILGYPKPSTICQDFGFQWLAIAVAGGIYALGPLPLLRSIFSCLFLVVQEV